MHPRHAVVAAAVAALALGTASSALAHGQRRAPRPAPAASFLKVAGDRKTVVFTILAGLGPALEGFNFDGYGKGRMVVTVPLNWTVDVIFKNVGMDPHSVVFEPWSENGSSANPVPAFRGAESPLPVYGTPPGQGARFRFLANRVGRYRFVCAFAGHFNLGMWDTFVVSGTVRSASVRV
jgi:hypothetical protein